LPPESTGYPAFQNIACQGKVPCSGSYLCLLNGAAHFLQRGFEKWGQNGEQKGAGMKNDRFFLHSK
jgi:hypothetical protein